jgi:orotidine-5'-phosphate decarboxylase
MNTKTELITALDFPDAASALQLVKAVGDAGDFYKVGLELFIAQGTIILPALKDMGKRIFLDLKLHDIPNTASKALLSCLQYDIDIVNVHAQGGIEMMAACAKALDAHCKGKRPLLIAVTLLTSLDMSHLQRFNINEPTSEAYVLNLARAAKEAGLDGVVSSAQETPAIKEALGDGFITVTPGIRLADGKQDDQKRVVTPQDAVKMGTNYIVVGRPITAAADPRCMTQKIQEYIK